VDWVEGSVLIGTELGYSSTDPGAGLGELRRRGELLEGRLKGEPDAAGADVKWYDMRSLVPWHGT